MTMSAAASAQPRLAHVAAAIGEPARAAMLARLLDGRYHTAGELASQAGIAASTASQHLKVLEDAQLVRVRPQGRHRYFMLADANVAHALEALLRVADDLAPEAARWERPAMQPLRSARCCYGHLAGRLGVQLHDALLARQWICPTAEGQREYAVTEEGAAALASWGVALPRTQGRRQLYGCVDWSERREHLAGPVAVAILEAAVERGWIRRVPDSRELRVTPRGVQALGREFGWLSAA
jgi:DNA-binding transcriptional ArsR family regulator